MALLGYKKFDWFDSTFFEEFETVNINGIRHYQSPEGNFPSMTTVLGALKGKDGVLDDWRKRIGDEEADRITLESSTRGTDLHKYCELYLKNELDRSIMKGQGKMLFGQIKRHLDDIDQVYGLEVPLYNKELKNAGRADAIVGMNNKLTIVDFKNSRHKMNGVGWKGRKLFIYMMQCVGYSRALKSQYGLEASQGCVIVGNWDTSDSSRFIFKIDDFWIKEFELINHAYHNNGEGIKDSFYFKIPDR